MEQKPRFDFKNTSGAFIVVIRGQQRRMASMVLSVANVNKRVIDFIHIIFSHLIRLVIFSQNHHFFKRATALLDTAQSPTTGLSGSCVVGGTVKR